MPKRQHTKYKEPKRKNNKYPTNQCANCDYELRKNKFKGEELDYCPRCGQYTFDVFAKTKAFKERIWEDMLDVKFGQTKNILYKLMCPGPKKLIEMYWNGQRKKVGSPFRLYMLITLLFFAITPITETFLKKLQPEQISNQEKIFLTTEKKSEIIQNLTSKKDNISASPKTTKIKNKNGFEQTKKEYYFWKLEPKDMFLYMKNIMGKNIKKGKKIANKNGYTRNEIIYSTLSILSIFMMVFFAALLKLCFKNISFFKHLITALYMQSAVLLFYLILFSADSILFFLRGELFRAKNIAVPILGYLNLFDIILIFTIEFILIKLLISEPRIYPIERNIKGFLIYTSIIFGYFLLALITLQSSELLGYFWEGFTA